MDDPRARAEAFCSRFGLKIPILLAPMAGACPPSLSIAVMRAQRGLTNAMRLDAQKTGDAQHMQVWAGQSAKLARDESASSAVERVWSETQTLLGRVDC